jgi:hypothetical protein
VAGSHPDTPAPWDKSFPDPDINATTNRGPPPAVHFNAPSLVQKHPLDTKSAVVSAITRSWMVETTACPSPQHSIAPFFSMAALYRNWEDSSPLSLIQMKLSLMRQSRMAGDRRPVV